MSDLFELDKLIKSLNVTPKEEAKQRAKVLFLQTAGQTQILKETKPEQATKPTLAFPKKKRTLLSIAAAMAAMLVLSVGILSAYDPTFLTGTVSGGGDIIQYRMFPSNPEVPELDTEQKYQGELSIFHLPGPNEEINNQFVKSDRALLTKGFEYYVALTGTQAATGDVPDARINNGLMYVPVNLSEYKLHYGNAVCIGELVLLKASDRALEKSGYLPCIGQTLRASNYSVLAKILSPGTDKFTLPDLRGEAPVDGAVWCIASRGDYPYIRSVSN